MSRSESSGYGDERNTVRRTIQRIAVEAAWAPLSILIAHTVAGAIFGHEPVVDPIMHFLGGAAACYFFRRAAELASSVLGTMKPLALDLFSFGLAGTMAVFWEIGEFTGDRLFRGHAQRGLSNTMRDLILGLAGAIVCLLFLRAVGFFRAAELGREEG